MTDFVRALKPALWAALWAFLGPMAILLLGVLQDVAEWASTNGRTPLPGLSTLGYAAVAAVCSATSGLIALVVRFAQTKGVLGGNPPAYSSMPARDARGRFVSDGGVANYALITAAATVVVAVVMVLWAFTDRAPFAGT